MSAFWMHQAAFALQLASLALFLGYMARPLRALSLAATAALSAAFLLQLLFTLLLGLQLKALPLGNAFQSLNFWALLFTGLTLVMEWRTRMGLLGAFLVPMSALLLLMGYRFGTALPATQAPAGGLFLLAHAGLPMAGFALFTASAALAAAFLVQERQLKRGQLSGLLYELPSLEELERLAVRSAGLGLAALSLGLLSSLAHPHSAKADALVAMSLLTFAFYGACLLLRRGGLRGRRFALLLLGGFTALFFAFYLVHIYWGGHASQGVS